MKTSAKIVTKAFIRIIKNVYERFAEHAIENLIAEED